MSEVKPLTVAESDRGIHCQMDMYRNLISRMDTEKTKMGTQEAVALRMPLYISLILGFGSAGAAFLLISRFTRGRIGIVARSSLSLLFGGCIGGLYYRKTHLEAMIAVLEDGGPASIALCPASELLEPCEREIPGFAEAIAGTEFGRMRRACISFGAKWTDSQKKVLNIDGTVDAKNDKSGHAQPPK